MENYKQWMEQKLTSEDMDKLPKVKRPLTDEEIEGIRMTTPGDISIVVFPFNYLSNSEATS